MTSRKLISSSLVLSILSLSTGLTIHSRMNVANAADSKLPPRPIQYVALAFDSSFSGSFGEEAVSFNRANNVRMTYFLSSVYFLRTAKRSVYQSPHRPRGRASIDFGGEAENVLGRMKRADAAQAMGSEMGSHLNGHFDAVEDHWTDADWLTEFSTFKNLMKSFLHINEMDKYSWNVNVDGMKGFRTPFLSYSHGLWGALKSNGYIYDTSMTNQPDYWPEKLHNGIWNFPLAEIRIVGSGKRTLSMDYNFYYTQSKAHEDPANYEKFEKQTFDTYMHYFQSNYNGNRAPVSIGHHMSRFNGGAYWRAMQHFAREVCHLPEVQCVTYTELAKFMESLPNATVKAYQQGKFDRSTQAPVKLVAEDAQPFDLRFSYEAAEDGKIHIEVIGKDAPEIMKNAKLVWKLDHALIGDGVSDIDLNEHLDIMGAKSVLNVTLVDNKTGDELLSSTREVKKPASGISSATANFFGPSPVGSDSVGPDHFEISSSDEEDLAIKGDLPGAHEHEDDQE